MDICEVVDIFLSSSSDSDEEELGELLEYFQDIPNPVPKVKHFLEGVIETYNNIDFKKNLIRVEKTTFHHLVIKFEDSESYKICQGHGGTPVKSAKVHIAAFLWFAGNKTVLRVVALLFDTSVSTMFCIIERVIKFLLDIGPQVIKFPVTPNDKQNIISKFFEVINTGFPNVLGCIDGSYINLRTPAHKVKSTYVNRHDHKV